MAKAWSQLAAFIMSYVFVWLMATTVIHPETTVSQGNVRDMVVSDQLAHYRATGCKQTLNWEDNPQAAVIKNGNAIERVSLRPEIFSKTIYLFCYK